MSTETDGRRGGAGGGRTARDRIAEHRDDLLALAESDLPAAKWARVLLEIVDGHPE